MERVVTWGDLVALIAPVAPEGKKGRPPFAVQTMLRIHFMQQCFTLSDPAMEEALHDVPLFRAFAQLSWDQRLPDESTIQRFRHLLEKHKLAEQILAIVGDMLIGKDLLLKAAAVVDATLIAPPCSTKNSTHPLRRVLSSNGVTDLVSPPQLRRPGPAPGSSFVGSVCLYPWLHRGYTAKKRRRRQQKSPGGAGAVQCRKAVGTGHGTSGAMRPSMKMPCQIMKHSKAHRRRLWSARPR
jgi:IS5 family transposase